MKFILNMLYRTLRGKELNILIISLLLAVTTMTSIGVFSSRIKNTIFQEASDFLGADAKISGTQEISQDIQTALKENIDGATVNTSLSIGFRAMAFAKGNMQLAQIKAVESNYPLRGSVLLAKESSRDIRFKPEPSLAYVSRRILNTLDVTVGDTLTIGEKTLSIAGVIDKEPDSAQSTFGFSPSIIISMSDVAETEVIQLGSRIDYNLFISGDKETVAIKKIFIEPLLGDQYQWTDAKNRGDRVGNTLARAERFLLLAGALSLLLTGTAIALAAKQFSEKQKITVALLKTFGFPSSKIHQLYIINIILVATIGAALGAFLGWLLHLLILNLLADVLPQNLAPADTSSYLFAAFAGWLALLSFSCVPLISLQKTTPLSIIRQESDTKKLFRLSLALGFLSIIALVGVLTGSWFITLAITIGLSALSISVIITTRLAIFLLFKVEGVTRLKTSLRLAFKNIRAHQSSNGLQILIFSIIFMLVLILIEVRGGLLDRWKNQIPEDAANHFAFNIFPEDIEQLQTVFDKNKIAHSPFYPMTRGRVLTVNGVALKELAEKHKGQMNYERELNLTWSKTLGADNTVTEGTWWDENTVNESDTAAKKLNLDNSTANKRILVSAEEEYAKGVGMKIGDTLIFTIAGQEIEAYLSSIRQVKWDSMNPNFFMVFENAIDNSAMANWLTSFHLSPDKKFIVSQINKEFPGISILEIDQTIEQIQDIISKVSRGIEFILSLVLLAGILVLVLSVRASVDERKKETAILRTLGASRRLIQNILKIEFSILGILSGLIAVIGAELSLYFIQTRLFDLGFEAHYWMWFLTPLASALMIATIGSLATQKVVATPPIQVLRMT